MLIWIFSLSHGENSCKILNGNKLEAYCEPEHPDPFYVIKHESVGCKTEETLRENIKTIDIRGCRLDDLHLFKNFTTLWLINQLESYLVGKDTFVGMKQLTHIKVGNSNLEVHESTFSQLPNLQTLELKENYNIFLSELTFRGGYQLKVLDLEDSSVSNLPSGIFRDLNGLEFLFLYIQRTSSAVDFTGLEKLKYLTLAFIQNQNLTEISFHNLKNLKYLVLSNCKFRHINTAIFSQLKNLIVLKLKNSEVELNASTFSGLTNLRSLDLSTNNINRIEDGAFSNLINLKKLDLSDNKLTALHEQTFKGLDNLKYLSLKRNSISAINANTFTALTKLIQLDLSHQRNEIESLDLNAFPQFIDVEKKSVIYTPTIESEIPDNLEKEESLWLKDIFSFQDEFRNSDWHRMFFGSFE